MLTAEEAATHAELGDCALQQLTVNLETARMDYAQRQTPALTELLTEQKQMLTAVEAALSDALLEAHALNRMTAAQGFALTISAWNRKTQGKTA